MFMVLAIGTLMDPSLPAFNLEAEKYHQLARAALFQSTMFDSPTLNAVQAVVSILCIHAFISFGVLILQPGGNETHMLT